MREIKKEEEEGEETRKKKYLKKIRAEDGHPRMLKYATNEREIG